MSTPSSSLMVLLYSVRLSRRAVTRPGSGGVARSIRSSSRGQPCRHRLRCSSLAAPLRAAASRRARSLPTTSSHWSRCSTSEARDSNDWRLSSFSCFLLPWQVKQFSARNGLTTRVEAGAGVRRLRRLRRPRLRWLLAAWPRADSGALWAEPTTTSEQHTIGITRSDRTHPPSTVAPTGRTADLNR